MDSESNLPKSELPRPNSELNESGAFKSPESFAVINPELKVQPDPNQISSNANQAVAAAYAGIAASQTTIQTDDPITGDDVNISVSVEESNVIEKQWIDKAKEIVARTHGDPHAKSTQLTYLKKDYIEKQYGKYIKLPDDQRFQN